MKMKIGRDIDILLSFYRFEYESRHQCNGITFEQTKFSRDNVLKCRYLDRVCNCFPLLTLFFFICFVHDIFSELKLDALQIARAMILKQIL